MVPSQCCFRPPPLIYAKLFKLNEINKAYSLLAEINIDLMVQNLKIMIRTQFAVTLCPVITKRLLLNLYAYFRWRACPAQ